MNKESLGKKVKNGNQEYECIAYADKPTITMKNLETGEKINMVVGSMLANEFEEIIEEDEIQPEDVLSFTLTDKVWTPRQARELIDNFRKISEKLKSKKDNNKIEKLKRITKCIGTDEEGTYYTDEYTIPELAVKIDEIIDKLNNME